MPEPLLLAVTFSAETLACFPSTGESPTPTLRIPGWGEAEFQQKPVILKLTEIWSSTSISSPSAGTLCVCPGPGPHLELSPGVCL